MRTHVDRQPDCAIRAEAHLFTFGAHDGNLRHAANDFCNLHNAQLSSHQLFDSPILDTG